MSLKAFLLQWLISMLLSPAIPVKIEALREQFPERTSLMQWRIREGKVKSAQIRYRPVPLSQISPVLRKAVLYSEDSRFYQHAGYDLDAMQEALWVNLGHGKIVRGGSTITQQLCKNLYLRPKRSMSRKLKEILLSMYLEERLGKTRILELYLNVIEWGPGVFGAEAAARYHFDKSAAELTPEECALLTAAIPSPLRARPANPSPYLSARANAVIGLLEERGVIEPGSIPF